MSITITKQQYKKIGYFILDADDDYKIKIRQDEENKIYIGFPEYPEDGEIEEYPEDGEIEIK
jgi:hypothetical protein